MTTSHEFVVRACANSATVIRSSPWRADEREFVAERRPAARARRSRRPSPRPSRRCRRAARVRRGPARSARFESERGQPSPYPSGSVAIRLGRVGRERRAVADAPPRRQVRDPDRPGMEGQHGPQVGCRRHRAARPGGSRRAPGRRWRGPGGRRRRRPDVARSGAPPLARAWRAGSADPGRRAAPRRVLEPAELARPFARCPRAPAGASRGRPTTTSPLARMAAAAATIARRAEPAASEARLDLELDPRGGASLAGARSGEPPSVAASRPGPRPRSAMPRRAASGAQAPAGSGTGRGRGPGSGRLAARAPRPVSRRTGRRRPPPPGPGRPAAPRGHRHRPSRPGGRRRRARRRRGRARG